MSTDYRKLLHEKSVRSALVKCNTSALDLNNITGKLKGLKELVTILCINWSCGVGILYLRISCGSALRSVRTLQYVTLHNII